MADRSISGRGAKDESSLIIAYTPAYAALVDEVGGRGHAVASLTPGLCGQPVPIIHFIQKYLLEHGWRPDVVLVKKG